MKTLLLMLLMAVIVGGFTTQTFAQNNGYVSPLETTSERRARMSADNYNTYRNNGNRAPMGGYNEPLGSPAPAGTATPGIGNGYKSNSPLSNQYGVDEGRQYGR